MGRCWSLFCCRPLHVRRPRKCVAPDHRYYNVFAGRRTALADAAALLFAGLDRAALVLPAVREQVVVIAQSRAIAYRARSDGP